MKKQIDKLRSVSRLRPRARNTQNFIGKSLRAPAAPESPVIGDDLLSGDAIGFADFLRDAGCRNFCSSLFGGKDTSAGTMLWEFRKALDFPHYYHGRPGKLTSNTATKKLLKTFARRAYRGDPDRRGVTFWERVAWLLWNVYAALMALRSRAETIKRQEIARLARKAAKRTSRAAYMRRYRAEQGTKQRAQPAPSKLKRSSLT
jgi:hypothetical protein